jgi:hypothetical protein
MLTFANQNPQIKDSGTSHDIFLYFDFCNWAADGIEPPIHLEPDGKLEVCGRDRTFGYLPDLNSFWGRILHAVWHHKRNLLAAIEISEKTAWIGLNRDHPTLSFSK